ncbi:MAG: hypothetical protein ABIG44_05700 [Planctomycetota bacterium]
MRRARPLALVVLTVVTVVSLAYTGGYAWYLRSAYYRQKCVDNLSTALGLPSDIGRVVPRSSTAQEYGDVVVWLPDRRDQALYCRQAVLRYSPTPADPDAYEIELLGGKCEISTRTWLQEDYRRVIESGLRPGFDPDGPRLVKFSGMDLWFIRNRFRGALHDASGVVLFELPDQGRATIRCAALNGHSVSEPVVLRTRFSPRDSGIRIDELKLSVPNLPVKVLGLEALIGTGLRTGMFGGELIYSETGSGPHLTISGRCTDLSLAECTAGLVARPWEGMCPEIELKELTLENDRPRRLCFRGVLQGLLLGDVLAPWGLEALGGVLTLRVRDADLSSAGIERLVASGECVGVSLQALTSATDWGRASGTVRLEIDDLTIEQNRLCSLDAEIRVEQTAEDTWIEGRLVTELVSRALDVNVPPFFPERIQYTQLGCRIEVRDEVLYLFGTHGPREKTILTVNMVGQEFPLILEPKHSFDLTSWLDLLRLRAAEHLRQRLELLNWQQAWRTLSVWPRWPIPVATQPEFTLPGDSRASDPATDDRDAP